MHLDVCDLGLTDLALVVLHASVFLAIVLQQLGQRVELHGAVWAFVLLGEPVPVTLFVPLHPLWLVCPEGALDVL